MKLNKADFNNKSKSLISSLDTVGLMPPQALDLEEAVLGALLLDKNAIDEIIDLLTPESFYLDAHQRIYKAILQIYNKRVNGVSVPIDILTVTNQIRSNNDLDTIGGAYCIAKLSNRVASSANIKFHAAILKEKHILREIIRISTLAQKESYLKETDVFDLLDWINLEFSKLAVLDIQDTTPLTRITETRSQICKSMKNGGMYGFPTGIAKLDNFLGGIAPGDLYFISGRSGGFKTALALYIQHASDTLGVPTLMFQMEMTKSGIGMREIALKSGVDTQNLRRGRLNDLEFSKMEKDITSIINSKVYIDDSPRQTIVQIKAKTKKHIAEYGVKYIVIDYLNLCNLEIKKYGTEESAISNFVAELKTLAKELNIGILLLGQFNKEAGKEESNSNSLKPPGLHLIKGSGAIEYSCDVVIFTWNPAKIDPNFVYTDNKGLSVHTKDKIAIIIAKNKNGETGMFWHGVKPSTNSFFDIELEGNHYTPPTAVHNEF